MLERVIIATRIFQPEPSAASLRLGAVAGELARKGVETRVLTVTAPNSARWSARGIDIRRFPVLRDATGYVRGYAQYMSFDIPLFFRLLASRRADVVLVEPPPTTGAVAAFVCALKGTPWVYYAADVWSDATESMGASPAVTRILRTIESFALSHATSVIAVSEGVAERVRALGATDVSVVRNGIDTDLFAQGSARGNSERPPYVVYAGTASEWQGAGIFVDAVEIVRKHHPDLELVYLGGGSDLPAIKERAAGRPWIRFLGQRSPEEAASWQAGALVALVSILPGKGYDFAYPTKVLAALSCGTPVVFAGVGPVVNDLEAHALGRGVAYDAREIARAIDSLIAEPPRAEHLSRWVKDNRSQQSAARAVAEVLEDAALRRGRSLASRRRRRFRRRIER